MNVGNILSVIVMAAAAFGFAGYTALLQSPIATSFVGKTARLPLLHNLVVGTLFLLGSVGVLLMYQAHRRKSRLKLAVGFFVVFFMFVMLELLFSMTLSMLR